MGCAESGSIKELEISCLSKPQIFFVLGGPGSGKGTQCDNMVRDYRFKHISTGDLLREEKERGGPQAETLGQLMKEGKMVPSQMVVRLMKNDIAMNGCRRYLIDGFPRNEENLKVFQEVMKDSVEVKKLIFFNCSSQVMSERIMERAKVSGRVDDNPESIKKRLDVYEQDTIPMVQKFRAKGNCISVNAENSRQIVYEELKTQISNANINTPSPCKVLFVNGPSSQTKKFCNEMMAQFSFKHADKNRLAREIVQFGVSPAKQIKQNQGKPMSTDLFLKALQAKMERHCYGSSYLISGFPTSQEDLTAWERCFQKFVKVEGYIQINQSGQEESPILSHFQKDNKLHRIDKENYDSLKKQLQILGFQRLEPSGYEMMFLVTPPGFEKQKLCSKIKEQFDFKCFHIDDLLKQESIEDGLYSDLITPHLEGKTINIPSEVIVRVLQKKIKQQDEGKINVVEGFPKCEEEQLKWMQICGDSFVVRKIIQVACSQKVIKQRLAKVNLSEDTLQYYQNETIPLIQAYKTEKIKLDGEKSGEQVAIDLKARLIKDGYKSK